MRLLCVLCMCLLFYTGYPEVTLVGTNVERLGTELIKTRALLPCGDMHGHARGKQQTAASVWLS